MNKREIARMGAAARWADKPAETRRTKQIVIRLSPAEADALYARLAEAGLSLPDFIVRMLRRAGA